MRKRVRRLVCPDFCRSLTAGVVATAGSEQSESHPGSPRSCVSQGVKQSSAASGRCNQRSTDPTPINGAALPGKSVTGEYAFKGKLDNPVTIQVKVNAWDATAYFGG
jgi:hypothetical protein